MTIVIPDFLAQLYVEVLITTTMTLIIVGVHRYVGNVGVTDGMISKCLDITWIVGFARDDKNPIHPSFS